MVAHVERGADPTTFTVIPNSAHRQRLTTHDQDSPPDAICPVCRRPVDRALFVLSSRVEPRFARRIRAAHPDWIESEGVCPACAFDAAESARRERSGYSLQGELQLPYPAYDAGDARLLPLAARLRAHPVYAGRRITIAFLDSGFYPHPDLMRPRERIRRYVDATVDEPFEAPLPKEPSVEQWHGTMTSCVGAGNGFLAQGMYAGLAPHARVVLVKAGNRRTRRIHDRDILRALQWVVDNHERDDIRIVNISLGGDRGATGRPSELDRLIEEAVALGMIVVCAAGNGGQPHIDSPATAPSAIVVGGVDDQNTLEERHWRPYHSDWGAAADGSLKPDVIAPAAWLPAPMLLTSETHNEGMLLWQLMQSGDRQFAQAMQTSLAREYFKTSTMRLPIAEIRQKIRGRMLEQKFVHAHYQHVDGTSFSAPIVSAIAAQMLEANPLLTPGLIKRIVGGTAERLNGTPAEPQGCGVINAARSVAAALRAPGGPLAGFPLSPATEPWGITFTCYNPDATRVALVGTFNGWDTRTHPLRNTGGGVWQITIETPAPGAHAYKFFVDSTRWLRDPENGDVVDDGCGDYHSVFRSE
ncbi:MAG: S8 family serine peptidase [Chloroflexi bacterium]|nr:S8 family serine peptidase [Chloroflexota bacterium]